MKKILACVLCLMLLAGCSGKIDYERLPVIDSQIIDFAPEQINEYFGQMIDDSLQARYVAYKIWLTLNISGDHTGDFSSIENAPMDKLIDQAVSLAPAIDHFYYTDVHGEGDRYDYDKNNIVSVTAKKAAKDGKAPSGFFYADDIEQTLIFLYGEYPIAGESYQDHFTSGERIEYYPKEGLFLQLFEYGGERKHPMILSRSTGDDGTLVCDFITVNYERRDDQDHYTINPAVELNHKNLMEEAGQLDVLRYHFIFALDDDRLILRQVETVGKFAELAHLYDINK
ncbi:MAG: hypothetical protein FWF04_00080 [Clostridiales bacterium]|nr:hypothetical protein [Clostridiales bacterium]